MVEPTVEMDCAFLLGAITIIGISSANKLLNENKKIRKITNIFVFMNIFKIF